MSLTTNLSPCIVCGNNVSRDCRCRLCDVRLHVFCAVPEGLEGHGAKYLCSVDCHGSVALGGVAESTDVQDVGEDEDSLAITNVNLLDAESLALALASLQMKKE
jgi:hypothetical protein